MSFQTKNNCLYSYLTECGGKRHFVVKRFAFLFLFLFFVSILVIFDLETINYFVKAKMLIGHLSEHSYSDYCTHIPAIVLRRPNVLCMAHHTHHQQ